MGQWYSGVIVHCWQNTSIPIGSGELLLRNVGKVALLLLSTVAFEVVISIMVHFVMTYVSIFHM